MLLNLMLAVAAAAIPATDAPVPPAPVAAAPAATPRPRTYCVVDQQVSSRIPLRTCHTRDEWLAQGFDPATRR